MNDFEGREQNFSANMGHTLGAFCRHVVEADNNAKDAFIQRVMKLIELPNIDIKTESSLIGLDEKLQTHLSVPPVIIAPVNPIEIQEATLDMSMEVSAHQEETTSVASETEVSGSAKIGLGMIGSIRVSVKANVSVSNERKRTSDYRATTDVHVAFKQGETPEGVSRLLDSINSTVSKSLEINEKLVDAKSRKLIGAVDEAIDTGNIPESPTETEE